MKALIRVHGIRGVLIHLSNYGPLRYSVFFLGVINPTVLIKDISCIALFLSDYSTSVDKQDKLTDQVYHYDVTDKVFEKASRYEDRKQEKDKSHEKKSVLKKLEEKKDEAKATISAKKTSYRDSVSL